MFYSVRRVERGLTICGDGSLTISGTGDGIQVENEDFTMESGAVSLGIPGDDAADNPVNENGLDLGNGDVIIKGGELTIHAKGHGMDVNGDAVFCGGKVSIKSKPSYGVRAKKTVEIYGGDLWIEANVTGIHGKQITIRGGDLTVDGWRDVSAEEVAAEVTLPEGVEIKEISGADVIDVTAGPLHIEAEHACVNRFPGDHLCDGCGKAFLQAIAQDGQILLEKIPAGLQVMISGYTGGRMKVLQVAENVIGKIQINSDVLACETIKAFFLNGVSAPLIEFLPVS